MCVLSFGILPASESSYRYLPYNLWPSYPLFVPLPTVRLASTKVVSFCLLRPCLILHWNMLFNAHFSFDAILQHNS